ncbi:MAG: hypothetical protein LPK85_09555, partial [Gammaproteobacteria bacterium]|nr:hypothetical protein [Gammaproteobacteria bacterium]
MQFAYRGRDAKGTLQEGMLEAVSRDAAASELMRRGIVPLQVEVQVAKVDVLERLRDTRAGRAQPACIDNVIVSWNALAARGLMEAGAEFSDEARVRA